MIKNLIYDFGKVLVDYDFEKFFRERIPDPDRRQEFARLVNNKELQDSFDRELVPFDTAIEEMIRQNPGFEKELRVFNEEYTDIVTGEVPGMRELLTRLKSEGFKLWGLTNWCNKVYTTMEQFEIFKLLDGRVISSEEKIIKPEPGIYQCLLKRFGMDASECVFTDDKAVNIEGARQVGIKSILFKDALQYEKELNKIISD